MLTFMEYILTEADPAAPPAPGANPGGPPPGMDPMGGPPPGGDPLGGMPPMGGGGPMPPMGGGGASGGGMPGDPMGGGMGGPGGGANPALQPPAEYRSRTVWDIFERILKGKPVNSKTDNGGTQTPNPVQSQQQVPTSAQLPPSLPPQQPPAGAPGPGQAPVPAF